MINDRNSSAQPPGPPAETTTLESRKGGPRRLRRVVRRSGALRSTTAELIRVRRHKFPDAHRRPAGNPLHTVRHADIPTRPVQVGHRHQMPVQVVRQPRPFQLPFPILGGDVTVRDLAVPDPFVVSRHGVTFSTVRYLARQGSWADQPASPFAPSMRSMCSRPPIAQRPQGIHERDAELGQGILDARRDLSKVPPRDDSVRLHLARCWINIFSLMPVTRRRNSPNRRGSSERCHSTIGFHLPPTTANAASMPHPYGRLRIALLRSLPLGLGYLRKGAYLPRRKLPLE